MLARTCISEQKAPQSIINVTHGYGATYSFLQFLVLLLQQIGVLFLVLFQLLLELGIAGTRFQQAAGGQDVSNHGIDFVVNNINFTLGRSYGRIRGLTGTGPTSELLSSDKGGAARPLSSRLIVLPFTVTWNPASSPMARTGA